MRVLVEVFLCVLKIHSRNLQCVLTRLTVFFINLPMLATQSVIEDLDSILPVLYTKQSAVIDDGSDFLIVDASSNLCCVAPLPMDRTESDWVSAAKSSTPLSRTDHLIPPQLQPKSR